ncbi:MAG: type IV toxin-antitoxin system AbiEi family antitoxin domain-containing protein [Nitriliruptoraceae bacterium]
MGNADRRELDRLARPRAGIVSRAALLDAGWSRSGLDRAVASALLFPVAKGVYRTSGTPWRLPATQHAALAAAGEQGALARRSAAEVLGLLEPRQAPHHLVIPHSRRPPVVPRTLAIVTRSRTVHPDEVVEVSGLWTTSAPRTLLDLAPRNSAARLAELAAAAIRLRHCGLAQLEQVVATHPGARGRSRLQAAIRILGDDGAKARAEVEIAAVAALLEADLPRPEVAFRVCDGKGRLIAEVDLAYPAWRLALEIDGYQWHSTPTRKRADETRQNRLVIAGWTVLRFSAEVVRRNPRILVDAVTQALPRAADGR